MQVDQNVISELIKQTPDLYDTYPDEWTFSTKMAIEKTLDLVAVNDISV